MIRKVIKNADLERVTRDDTLELPIVEYLPLEDAIVENPARKRGGSLGGRSEYGDEVRSQRGASPDTSRGRRRWGESPMRR